jgi:serine/threonine-protein kinase
VIGQEIGNYRIVRELGVGGMGQVFVAEHGILGHEVAIKILHGRYLEDDEMRARFLNEARAVAKLKHPSIVDLFDFGYLEDGTGYIIMELLSGQSLRERLGAGPLAIDEATELARQVAAALGAAHDQGVVHRDLKPDNIFLVADSEATGGQRAVVLDFGLAKQVAVETTDTELTNSGFVVGTPAYMSPEQCRGVRDLDGRSDIYALGAVIYRMCTGKRPFDADSPGELLGQHLYVEPTRPRTLRPEITRELEDIILRCLAKQPEERFADARELAESLSKLGATPAPRLPVPSRGKSHGDEPAFVAGLSQTDLAEDPPDPGQATVALRKRPVTEDAPPQRPSRWPWLVALVVVAAGGATVWATLPGSRARATTPAMDAGAPVIDAARNDSVSIDAAAALADATPADAGAPDAAPPPRSGRELILWVSAARRRGDAAAGLAACKAGEPDDSSTYSACALVACSAGDEEAARAYWRSIREESTRRNTARACASAGIDVRK